ncbi:MAG: Asp-tRNA(Asn)/Glu-tRNA(Gln) amidotransferase subunit GatA [Calditrichaeota bacterium]|nr:Asp-tRNA(Asn)/Glu-tRNA(Gln) amidotransferase subunit GatA [Calditrichota bacterium]HQU71831.1 Asp-tRNA(Asn)/Glu-tRNA(Gln) amidotransferase subunit GatA [Calditrichia bacterium]
MSHLETALERRRKYLAGEFTLRDTVDRYLETIEKNRHLNAFVRVNAEGARAHAAEIDARRAAGKPLGPLAGVVVALKDNICQKGQIVSCASKILANFESPYDATVVEKIQAADGVVIGQTNMDEFAMGSSTENSAFGPALNPVNPEYVSGGSSGGSAVAVAAGMADISLGSDTGGSIRQPASFCGVVGLKPTYGRVSRYGLVAFASSLDQIGPFGRSVADTALMLSVISGEDPGDSTCVPAAVPDYVAGLDSDVAKLRIGLPEECFGEGLDPEVKDAINAVLDKLRADGHETVPVHLRMTDYAIATYYIIATAEASSNLARYDGVRYGVRSPRADALEDMYLHTRSEGFGAEVKRRIMLGTYVLSAGYYDAYYKKAQQVRRLIRREYDKAFESVDILLTPTTPTPAFRLGEKADDPLQMYLSDIYTVTVNLAGTCALSMPCGTSSSGMPIGLQLIGQPFKESELLAMAHKVEGML